MFKSTITEVGPLVEEMAKEAGMLVVFNENAPSALAEIAAQHTLCELERPVKPGDLVRFGDKTYTVTAAGDEANNTLAGLGHCSFKFTGHTEVDLPGQIELDGGGQVPMVKVGDAFDIEFK